MKSPEYFPHDFSARNDKRIISLCSKHGAAGGFVYWCIIEILHEEKNNQIEDDDVFLRMLSLQSWTKKEKLKGIISFCLEVGLLKKLENRIFSERVKTNMLERINRQNKYKEAGSKGGKTAAINRNLQQGYSDATAMQEQSKSGGIPLKGKEKGERGKGKREILKENLSLEMIGEENSKTSSQPHIDLFLKDSEIKSAGAVKFINDQKWLSEKAKHLEIEYVTIEEAAKSFLIHIRDRDLLDTKPANDYKSHFINWIKLDPKNLTGYNNHTKSIYVPNIEDR
jgi:hypothetical protein